VSKPKPIIALAGEVEISAAAPESSLVPRKFTSTFYTGGALEIEGWDLPVVVDLVGLEEGKVLVANLDHDRTKRVGNFAVANDGKSLVASGTASARTPARDEVVGSADEGYQWQASLEVSPKQVETVKSGKTVTVNGQEFTGPIYVTRKGVLKGFAFVSHGADDNTTATIAASAANSKEKVMDTKAKAWIEAMGFDVETLTDDQKAGLLANFEGKNGKKPAAIEGSTPLQKRKLEAQRRQEIKDLADQWAARRENDFEYIDAIEKACDHAIEQGLSVQEFKNELFEASIPMAHPVAPPRGRDRGVNARVLEAAICKTGRLIGLEDKFTDQELQLAHDRFRDGISLNQFFIYAAEANGYRANTGGRMSIDVQRAAFGMGRQIHAAGGFSTIDVANIVGAVANKFIMEAWNAIDLTPLRIAKIKNVRNFQQTTTVSLTGALQFEELGAAGEIKHGTLDEVTYNNQAKTFAQMLAITRQDIINDDLGALTDVPRKLGRGAGLLLNHLFWTVFLNNTGSFFTSGNSNVNEGVADMTVGGLDATETIFLNQTDYDSKPLGVEPAILLVPTALKNKARTLMGSMGNGVAVTSYATGPGSDNPFVGRFRVESSPYMSNSSYTGYSAAAWYMLAEPSQYPVVEIAALNGRVEPTVDTAEADFNTLGVQMRGYCDIGVALQEKKYGVRADGGSS
jgi:hypothetical protein